MGGGGGGGEGVTVTWAERLSAGLHGRTFAFRWRFCRRSARERVVQHSESEWAPPPRLVSEATSKKKRSSGSPEKLT